MEEAVSVVGQVAGALAVGETVSLLPPTATTVSLSHTHTHTGLPQALEMEHRDLHLSNILVRKTKQKSLTFRLDNQEFPLPSHGVKATVVDYTISRVKQGAFVCLWNAQYPVQ